MKTMLLWRGAQSQRALLVHPCLVTTDKTKADLWTAGQERLDVNVGVVDFEIVVAETSGDSYSRQHTSLQKMRRVKMNYSRHVSSHKAG